MELPNYINFAMAGNEIAAQTLAFSTDNLAFVGDDRVRTVFGNATMELADQYQQYENNTGKYTKEQALLWLKNIINEEGALRAAYDVSLSIVNLTYVQL